MALYYSGIPAGEVAAHAFIGTARAVTRRSMDRVTAGLLTIGIGMAVGVAPTFLAVGLVALGQAASPVVRWLEAEVLGAISLNLLLCLFASPVVLAGLATFREGLRRAAARQAETPERQETTTAAQG